jgi:sporulation protein YlmC with PRC-barrel domain
MCGEALMGKPAMDSKGFYIGKIKGIIEDQNTNTPRFLLIEPSADIQPEHFTLNEDNNIVFPCDSIEFINNVVMILEK